MIVPEKIVSFFLIRNVAAPNAIVYVTRHHGKVAILFTTSPVLIFQLKLHKERERDLWYIPLLIAINNVWRNVFVLAKPIDNAIDKL